VRLVANPRKIWFFTQGNGGQASERYFAFHCFNDQDSIYILEYPGYGGRLGRPSQSAFNDAARTAYEWLAKQYGVEKLLVVGESLGSGVASYLATIPAPPNHTVLLVPFDVITEVAQEKFPFIPAKLLMRDRWNNVEALKNYRGKLDIFGAKYDRVIPVHHARNLTASHPESTYHEFVGDHGWANGNLVDLSNIE
jgi:pimeloyl-ACP methyl ester carboxylesterase